MLDNPVWGSMPDRALFYLSTSDPNSQLPIPQQISRHPIDRGCPEGGRLRVEARPGCLFQVRSVFVFLREGTVGKNILTPARFNAFQTPAGLASNISATLMVE